MGKEILVTGHTGLVGKNLVEKLREQGHKVTGISKTNGFDLTDTDLTKREIENVRPQIVFHLAANAAESRGQASPLDMTRNNLDIFLSVLRASINAKAERFVYVSSVAVYGEAPTPYMEDGPMVPKDVYGVNKLACEQILRIMAKVYGFDYVIFRPHNIYGPGQKMNDPYRNVVALFMRNIIEGKPYTLFGEGKMIRGFSYVDDVVEVMAKAVDSFTNKSLNVGSEQSFTIRELSDLIQDVSGRWAKIEYLPSRPQEIYNFTADHARQRELTSYQETPLREGLKKTWDWVIARPLGELNVKPAEI